MYTDNALQADQGKWTAFFYWVGIVLALACMGLVLAKNTPFVIRWERAPIPLCWLAGIGSILSFILAEACDRANPGPEQERSPYDAALAEATAPEAEVVNF